MRRKKIITISFLFISTFLFTQYHPAISQDKKKGTSQLVPMYYKKYIGNSIYDFLLDDSIRKYKSFVFNDEPPGILRGATIELPNHDEIEIIVSKYTHLNPSCSKRNWDKDLFYAEKISQLKVYRNGKCIFDSKPANTLFR